MKNAMNKPTKYSHLSASQMAIQQVLNGLDIIIRVNGSQIAGDSCPFSFTQLIAMNCDYLAARDAGTNPSYIINMK